MLYPDLQYSVSLWHIHFHTIFFILHSTMPNYFSEDSLKIPVPAFKYLKVTHQITHSNTISCCFRRVCRSYPSLCGTNAVKIQKELHKEVQFLK